MKNEPFVRFTASMLTEPMTGIHTIWTYWSDGTVTEEKKRLSAPVIVLPLRFW